MVTGLKAAAQLICALLEVCCGDAGIRGQLGRLLAILGALSARTSIRAAALAFIALAVSAPAVAVASPGCDYLAGNALSSGSGVTLTGDYNTNPIPALNAPNPFTSGAANFVVGDTIVYSYDSLNNARATVRRALSNGSIMAIVTGATAAGGGSFPVTANHTRFFVVTQVVAAGPGSVAFRMYCEVMATQAVATATATVGSPVDLTPVTAKYGSGSHVFGISPSLPVGLSFNTSTGRITGTPSTPSTVATYTVTVNYSGGSGSSSKTFELAVNLEPTVSAVSPTSGPAAGGTSVTITGTGFLSAAATNAVSFGANAATYTIDSDTRITATAPAGTGAVDVTVTTTGGTSAISASDLYTYIPAPAVTAVSPDTGPMAGGTTVTVTGTDFTDATAVSLGANAATSFSVDGPTQITATSPAGTGVVDISVTTPSGTSAPSAADRFTYAAAPTIDTATPASGSTTGGTAVTLSGTNLTGATLTVDGATVTPTGSTATTLAFTTPAHAAGMVTVVATTAGGSASTSFTYVAPPTVSSFVAASVAYDAMGATFSLAGHASNGPTGYAVGSVGTAQGGSVSVDAAGLVTYSAPSGFRGNDSFVFTASNAGGTSAPSTVTVPVSNPTLSSSLVASGTRGAALSGVQISTNGGAAPYGCSTTLASGTLPAGMQLNGDCSISGTPLASGTFSFTVNVTDSSTGTGPFTQASGQLVLTIAAPTINLSPADGALPAGAVGASYSQQFAASGGTTGYTYVQTAGELPPGLTLSGDLVSGAPTARGVFSFDITATDSSTVASGGPYERTRNYSIDVAMGTQTISFAPLSNVSLSSSPLPLAATASSGLAVSFASTTSTACTVVDTTVTLVDLGLCSITASQVGDADWSAATDVVQSFTVTPGTLVLTADAATGLQVGTPYTQTNTVSGGLGPYTYSLRAGAFSPGTSLDPATGTLSGTPTVAGTFSYIVGVSDGQSPPATATTGVTTVTIARGNQTISFASTAPTGATAGGTPYSVAAVSNSLRYPCRSILPAPAATCRAARSRSPVPAPA